MLDNQPKFISEKLEVKIDLDRKNHGNQGGNFFYLKVFYRGFNFFKDRRSGEIKKTNTRKMFVFGVEFSLNENLDTISF